MERTIFVEEKDGGSITLAIAPSPVPLDEIGSHYYHDPERIRRGGEREALHQQELWLKLPDELKSLVQKLGDTFDWLGYSWHPSNNPFRNRALFIRIHARQGGGALGIKATQDLVPGAIETIKRHFDLRDDVPVYCQRSLRMVMRYDDRLETLEQIRQLPGVLIARDSSAAAAADLLRAQA